MNASKQSYQSSLLNLAGSHHVETASKIVEMRTDDKLQVAQTLTNEFGNQLLGASGITGLQKLGKFANSSTAEKAQQLVQAAKQKLMPSSDGAPVAADSTKGVEEASQQASTDGVVESADGSSRIGAGASSAVTDASGDSEIASASQAAQGGGDEAGVALTDASNVVTKTSGGTEAALGTLTGESAAADDNPVGLAVTAALGIATIFAGMFIHPSKPKVIQTAQKVLPNNFGVQAGLN